jgi:HEAT repeat protein
MPDRRRSARIIAGIVLSAVVVTALVCGVKFGLMPGSRGPASTEPNAAITGKSSLLALSSAMRQGDSRAMAQLQERALPPKDGVRQPLGDQEAKDWLDCLSNVRAAYPALGPQARAAATSLACRILDLFAIDPAPASWAEALQPLHDVLEASMADPERLPRVTALNEVGRYWVWIPGRSLLPAEEQILAEWKGGLYGPVVRCLAARDEHTRLAAVACLGALPIDDAALAAVGYVEDSNPDVRRQTLSSFARRNLLLTDEMVLKHLHDQDPVVREMASLILKTRGLSQELISLGGLMYSAKPDQRVSVIPLLKDRADLDPVVWLIQLSRDTEEMVRMSAVAALADHKSPKVQRRLAEMARSDSSAAVRQAASKVVPSAEETTAALPPLPGSPSLNPKAN